MSAGLASERTVSAQPLASAMAAASSAQQSFLMCLSSHRATRGEGFLTFAAVDLNAAAARPLTFAVSNCERPLKGVPDDQPPAREHARIEVADADARQRHAPELVHGIHTEHNPELELQGARADPRGRSLRRVQIHVTDAIHAQFEVAVTDGTSDP